MALTSLKSEAGDVLVGGASCTSKSPPKWGFAAEQCTSFSASMRFYCGETMAFLGRGATPRTQKRVEVLLYRNFDSKAFLNISIGSWASDLPKNWGNFTRAVSGGQCCVLPLANLALLRASGSFVVCGSPSTLSTARGVHTESSEGEGKGDFAAGDSRGDFDLLFGLDFDSPSEATKFVATAQALQNSAVEESAADGRRSHLEEMDPQSVANYFAYYARLSAQRDMMRDATRTSAYKTAIAQNRRDFFGRRVMDVGAGTGILSFFAAMEGARRV